ncbi:uncharacterized protein LOC128445124 isoform X1 [Pleuronectes platessa]|uniref:uncharacterized protein LOC128445124 isoform X1 n=1 Tax=Pleuronectes platessa TaxID=8262 RepID=UPI00232A7428|nr:uncharacterized protein LOC128445124 isoform X1 [Pleuronectes platessa]
MEEPELLADDRRFRRFPVWIIEHVWTHRTMDIQQVVDPSDWPDVDSQPLSTEDSWRLRVASAQMFCIVRNRDMQHFERVMRYLEATFRLLPRLVAPIKHMKIMFGLKTLVVMWMLRQRRGMVDTVFKIIQFFPNKLPQYQDQCNQHEMFLMRKNNLDFRVLAQALATDEDKLQYYVKTQMQQQYGERYAQKVEDRLLHYLQELEAALPGDTFIDKILKKESPVTEEEKLLLDVITSDSTAIAITLRKLLHCDAASCRQAVSQASEHGATQVENSGPSKSVVFINSSKTLFSSVEDKTPQESQPEVLNPEDESAQEVSAESPDPPDVGRRLQSEDDGEMIRCLRAGEAAASPQFCSKHQRWVKSILQECPDEAPEELQLQADAPSSPPLFQLSSCTSSSQDLTPSDLVPCPPDRQLTPSQTATRPPPASEQGNLEDERRSGSAGAGSLPQCCSRDAPLSSLLSPAVCLMDVSSVSRICSFLKPHHASPETFIVSQTKLPASTPQALPSPQDSGSAPPTNPTNTTSRSQTSHEASAFTSCGKPPPQTFLRLSLTHRRALTASRRSQTLDEADRVQQAPASHRPSSHLLVSSPSASASQSEALSSNRNPSSPRSTRQNSPLQLQSDPRTAASSSSSSSSSSNTDHLPVRSEVSGAQLSEAVLLQPYVILTRLSAEEIHRLTRSRRAESESPADQENVSDSSFDSSFLHSSRSSSGDDSLDSDPDYKPPPQKKRRPSECESAEILSRV